jgi:hypothetical protein
MTCPARIRENVRRVVLVVKASTINIGSTAHPGLNEKKLNQCSFIGLFTYMYLPDFVPYEEGRRDEEEE